MPKYQVAVTSQEKEFSFEMDSPDEPTIVEALDYFMKSSMSSALPSVNGVVHGVHCKSIVLL